MNSTQDKEENKINWVKETREFIKPEWIKKSVDNAIKERLEKQNIDS